MAVSLRNVRSGVLVVILLGIPVLLLRSTLQDPRKMSAFDRSIHRVGAPLEAGITYSARWVGSFFEQWVLQARMLEEKERLEQVSRDQRRQLRDLARLEEENRQLRRALQMRDQVPEDLLAAEVTGSEQSPFFRVVKIQIDRGNKYVAPGMAVISPDGVVGRVQRAYDDHADVMLVTDSGSKIAVELARTRAPGILVGAGEDACSLELSSDDVVEVGDVVQTSGADDLFPKGRPVGRVASVERRSDRLVLEVVPSVRFDRLEVVWVVLADAPDPDPDAGAPRRRLIARGIGPID